jgi:hypothetical protein
MVPDGNKPRDPGYLYLPSVRYKKAPIYFYYFQNINLPRMDIQQTEKKIFITLRATAAATLY